ncbi:MAG: cytochrome-c oxidase, cbb3-type subunit I [Planctomycetota bacterium]
MTAQSDSAVLEHREITYDDKSVRAFMWWSVGWGLIGMLVGLLAALQLSLSDLSFDLPWLTFGRIRPLHTNAVIFALVGNMMFAGIYYSTQRLLKTRMASDFLSRFHLWSWQLIILGAAITLPMGITQSKEYAELEWFLDLAVVLSWVAFGANFFWTLKIRNEKHLYVAIWFYIATIVTIALLYVVNNLALPISGSKSYGLFAGGQDALTQWWYGHNAVAFFLTTPILGIMYYFLPKAAERPVYSYRLSIVHFWALVFIYIWAGPHHLLYTALPEWAQSLGMVFSLMLWAPSWGGMLNGLLTLRGAWHKLRTDPVLKFFAAGVTFYGMSTFEGPLLSIRGVSALAHYTDWIIAHVHGGALGWNGFMAAGLFYWLAPKLYGRELWSTNWANWHFWIGTFGILIYVVSMWVAGVTEGLSWRELTPDGGLAYSWVTVIEKTQLMYWARSLGGALYIVGWVMMFWNLWKTAKLGEAVTNKVKVAIPKIEKLPETTTGLVFGKPTILTVGGLVAGYMMIDGGNIPLTIIGFVLLFMVIAGAFFCMAASRNGENRWHDAIEQKPLAFTLATLFAVALGGVVELVPGIVIHQEAPMTPDGRYAVAPYTPLELTGRDIYVREGCYTCHSQMIRPLPEEQLRYGDPSHLAESMWDRPFQWGSKRTGPDLARVGGNKPDDWHYDHMNDPDFVTDGSNMPAYPWLLTDRADVDLVTTKLEAMQSLGVPYTDEQVASADADYKEQAEKHVQNLADAAKTAAWDSEIVALIAYLQRLGQDELTTEVAEGGN